MTKVALAALAVVAIAGFAAHFIPTAQAGAVNIVDLPGLGYSLGVRVDASASPPCQAYYVIGGNGAPETLIGDFGDIHPACNTDPAVMQTRIDALLANYPPRPAPAATVTVTLPAETVTAPAVTVTSPAVTTTLPAVTTTRTVTLPTQTVERTETLTLPAVTLPAVTTTVTDTTAVASLQARVTAQRAQIVRLTKQKRRR